MKNITVKGNGYSFHSARTFSPCRKTVQKLKDYSELYLLRKGTEQKVWLWFKYCTELYQALLDKLSPLPKLDRFWTCPGLSPLERDPAKYLLPRLFLAHFLIETFLL